MAIIKKVGLDPKDVQNYVDHYPILLSCPRLCHQLAAFPKHLNLLSDVQSAYTSRRKHLTETAVLKVITDVLRGWKHSTETAVLKLITDVLRGRKHSTETLMCYLDGSRQQYRKWLVMSATCSRSRRSYSIVYAGSFSRF